MTQYLDALIYVLLTLKKGFLIQIKKVASTNALTKCPKSKKYI